MMTGHDRAAFPSRHLSLSFYSHREIVLGPCPIHMWTFLIRSTCFCVSRTEHFGFGFFSSCKLTLFIGPPLANQLLQCSNHAQITCMYCWMKVIISTRCRGRFYLNSRAHHHSPIQILQNSKYVGIGISDWYNSSALNHTSLCQFANFPNENGTRTVNTDPSATIRNHLINSECRKALSMKGKHSKTGQGTDLNSSASSPDCLK